MPGLGVRPGWTMQTTVWDHDRPQAERIVLERHRFSAGGLGMTFATEDVRAPTDWCFEEGHHTVVVHLAGSLDRMESVFSRGPSVRALPQVGDIWVIPAGCRYAALAHGSTVRFAEFGVPTRMLGDVDLIARIGHRDEFLHRLAERTAGLAARDDDLARMMVASLGETLSLHFRDAFGPPASRPDRHGLPDGIIERLRAHIHDQLDVSHSLAEMAALAGLPVHGFLTAFRKAFGTTPWDYLVRARLQEGRRLLIETDQPVTGNALTTGFSTPSHFATAFKRRYGLSPLAYRRSMSERSR